MVVSGLCFHHRLNVLYTLQLSVLKCRMDGSFWSLLKHSHMLKIYLDDIKMSECPNIRILENIGPFFIFSLIVLSCSFKWEKKKKKKKKKNKKDGEGIFKLHFFLFHCISAMSVMLDPNSRRDESSLISTMVSSQKNWNLFVIEVVITWYAFCHCLISFFTSLQVNAHSLLLNLSRNENK